MDQNIHQLRILQDVFHRSSLTEQVEEGAIDPLLLVPLLLRPRNPEDLVRPLFLEVTDPVRNLCGRNDLRFARGDRATLAMREAKVPLVAALSIVDVIQKFRKAHFRSILRRIRRFVLGTAYVVVDASILHRVVERTRVASQFEDASRSRRSAQESAALWPVRGIAPRSASSILEPLMGFTHLARGCHFFCRR